MGSQMPPSHLLVSRALPSLPHTTPVVLGLLLPFTPGRGLVANFGKVSVGVKCAHGWHLGMGQGGSLLCQAGGATVHVAGHLATASHAPWIQPQVYPSIEVGIL